MNDKLVAGTGTTRIAHLSDTHVLDTRPSQTRTRWSMRMRFLSFGRPLDPEGRRQKLSSSLAAARQAGASHFVLSGDLTEIGAPGQFETLAEILHGSGIPPEAVTLVPGNHDVYTSKDAWGWALDGPLAAFARTSAREPGKVVEAGGVYLLPTDVTFHQPVTRAAGRIDDETLRALEQRAADPALSRHPLVVVQHHPPFVRETSAWHWLDGLIGAQRMMSLLGAFRHLFVLHGHLHAKVDRAIDGVSRIFGATATVDDEDAPMVRLYDVMAGHVAAAGLVVG